ncbi:MAG: Flp family type IVb pilin [Sphingobium sp.]
MRAIFDRLRLRALLKCSRAATAVEYGLILAMIFLVMIVALTKVTSKTINMWNNIATEVTNS